MAISLYLIASYYAVPVSAVHDTDVVLTPAVANCDQLGQTYTVTITNNGTSNQTREVRIYRDFDLNGSADPGIVSFSCGPAPTNWTLTDQLALFNYCQYETTFGNVARIAPGETLSFTFTATLDASSATSCGNAFRIATIDDDTPQGQLQFKFPSVKVDCSDPSITKTIGDPKMLVGTCDPQYQSCYYITQNTPIDIDAADNSDPNQCDLGLDKCEYRYSVDSGPFTPWTPISIPLDDFLFPEDSNHIMEIRCFDLAGNMQMIKEQDIVDTDPPVTAKTYGTPFVTDGTYDWITSGTPIDLSAVDPQPHPSGVQTLFWRNTVLTEVADQDCIAACNFYGSGQWNEVDGNHITITKPEESCHLIEFYATDMLGNTEYKNRQCVFVDNTPPVVSKDVGKPQFYDDAEQLLELNNLGVASWDSSDSSLNSWSAELSIMPTPGTDSFSGVDSFFDVFTALKLSDVSKITYDRKVTSNVNQAWSPLIVLGLDADGDGVFEAQPLEWEASFSGGVANPALLGDDTFIQCEATTGVTGTDGSFVNVDAYNGFSCYTPNAAGDNYDPNVYQPLSYFQTNSVGKTNPNQKILMLKVMINVPAANGETVLVDNVDMNDVIVIDEPILNIGGQTPITLSCQDQLPHPVDQVSVWYRFKIDSDPFSSWTLYTSPIVFGQDSRHAIEYYCEDKLGNKGPVHTETDIVDATPPQIIKTIGQPAVGDCPPSSPNDQCYIQNHVTPITFDVLDVGPHLSGLDRCDWSYTVDDVPTGSGKEYDFPFNIIFPQDSVHVLNVTCYDNLGNAASDEETFLVDSTPPVTTKTYDLVFSSYGSEWITTGTNITFSAQDQNPHPVGLDKTYYRITLVNETYCSGQYQLGEGQSNCDYAYGSGPFVEYPGTPVNVPQESCHLIEFYSTDLLGNTEQTKRQCPFVDNTPPVANKMIGDPKVVISGNQSCQAPPNGGGGGGGSGNVGAYVATVNFSQKCASGVGVGIAYDGQNLWYSCAFTSGTDLYRADPLTGVVSASYDIVPGGSLGALAYDATRNAIWAGYADSSKQIRLVHLNSSKDVTSTTLEFVAPVGGIALDDGLAYDASDDTLYLSPDVDATIYHLTITGTLIGSFPKAPGSGCGNSGLAIGGDLLYEGFNGCNQVLVVNKTSPGTVVFGFSTQQSGDPAFRDEDLECDTNTFAAQGKHVMWSVEAYDSSTQNRRALAFEIPFGSCGIGGQAPVCQNTTTSTYITQYTPINITCIDPQPHPVDHATVYWRYSINGANFTPWNSSQSNFAPIYFNEDSQHTVEYYCVDALGNTEPVQSEIDIVDTQPPEITKTIVGPQYGQCPPPNDNDPAEQGLISNCTIDGVTEIHVDVADAQPHPVGGVSCTWEYHVSETGFFSAPVQETAFPFVINFPEESTHVLVIRCNDTLGNYATDIESYVVDKTPPVTTKTYGTPFFSDQVSEWATSQTPVTLTATDSIGTHDTGVSSTQYRVTLMQSDLPCQDNNVCQQQTGSGNFQSYLYPFSAPQESCHLIEYYSVDGVNKTETLKKQCVFIDNTAPLPNKTIGEPKVTWDGSDAIFYNLAGKCWNNQSDSIDCWKVTMFTPVTLDCSDPQPHPVDHENVCFKVELDTKDETQSYCNNLEGNMNGNGYCCILGTEAPFTLYFSEESEHNLAFYCTDALNNTGPIDDEKFKVEGTPFKVPLKFKWNLISVPFVLLDDDIDVVFKDIKNDIDSVWAYDQGQWYVWTPGPAPDTLTNIQPGWGYWVLAKNDTNLIIGGSLFNPAKTPPSKNLVRGWNLVGYYGVQWQDFETVDPFCGDQEESFSSRSFCSLASLVDTQQGYPRWSSIWGFKNCVNGPDSWYGVQTCGNKPYNSMFAGKGYWLEIDVPEIYAPPTTCVWNNQNICVNQPNLP